MNLFKVNKNSNLLFRVALTSSEVQTLKEQAYEHIPTSLRYQDNDEVEET